jgi:hypothetical protein
LLLLEEVSFSKEADGRNEEIDDNNGKCDGVSVVDAFLVIFELLIAVTDRIGTKRAAINRFLTSKLILYIIEYTLLMVVNSV